MMIIFLEYVSNEIFHFLFTILIFFDNRIIKDTCMNSTNNDGFFSMFRLYFFTCIYKIGSAMYIKGKSD